MITGYDSVMIARSPAGPAVRAMLDGLHNRWPHMLVGRSEAEETAIGPFLPWLRTRDHVPAGTGELYVARDKGMEKDWDDYGYDLRDDGEGPFAVLYRPSPRSTTAIRVDEEPYEDRGFRFSPHPAVLVTAGLSLITMVTPDEGSPFSRDLRDRLTRALSRRP
ncbi:hypothetical protein [Actinoplanes sp. RD1]|uniref:hypothetical protein n=1 Tax=Actinoplanes sp. RD1 TaxID=3064538 RepID=UPI002740E7FF|nr:hypothetical protein [Actinoplanes sp. RD1]